MKCHYCGENVPMGKLTFILDGKVPGIAMTRRRAHCGCTIKVAIDGKPSESAVEPQPGGDDDGCPF